MHKGNRNYNVSPVRGKAQDAVRERVREVLALVTKGTSLCVNLPLEGSYFATGRGIEFGWHQDHEGFFALQNASDARTQPDTCQRHRPVPSVRAAR